MVVDVLCLVKKQINGVSVVPLIRFKNGIAIEAMEMIRMKLKEMKILKRYLI